MAFRIPWPALFSLVGGIGLDRGAGRYSTPKGAGGAVAERETTPSATRSESGSYLRNARPGYSDMSRAHRALRPECFAIAQRDARSDGGQSAPKTQQNHRVQVLEQKAIGGASARKLHPE